MTSCSTTAVWAGFPAGAAALGGPESESTMAGILTPAAPTNMPTWVFSGSITEQGTFNGEISPPDPTTGMQQVTGQWSFTTMTAGTAIPFNSAANSYQWVTQTTSTGWEVEVAFLSGSPDQPLVIGRINATFWQQDDVTACFMPTPLPGVAPGPCITAAAGFTTWGSVTDNVFLGQSNGMLQQLDLGTTQYMDQGTETIIMPDDPSHYSARLYSALHELDARGYDWIAVETPGPGVEWEAVLDRLITGLTASSPLSQLVLWRTLQDATQVDWQMQELWQPWPQLSGCSFPETQTVVLLQRADSSRHYVAVCGGRVYDPLLETPVALAEYSERHSSVVTLFLPMSAAARTTRFT